MGGVHNTRGNSRGLEGLFLCSKNGNSGEEGRGAHVKFSPMVGVWIFPGSTYFLINKHENPSSKSNGNKLSLHAK